MYRRKKKETFNCGREPGYTKMETYAFIFRFKLELGIGTPAAFMIGRTVNRIWGNFERNGIELEILSPDLNDRELSSYFSVSNQIIKRHNILENKRHFLPGNEQIQKFCDQIWFNSTTMVNFYVVK